MYSAYRKPNLSAVSPLPYSPKLSPIYLILFLGILLLWITLSTLGCDDPPAENQDIAQETSIEADGLEDPLDDPEEASDGEEDPADTEEQEWLTGDLPDVEWEIECWPAGQKRCRDDATVEECSPNGLWTALVECRTGTVCYTGICVMEVDCTPGEVDGCSSDTDRLVCNPNGTIFIPEPCPEGLYCFEGSCGEQQCAPGDQRCASGAYMVEHCADDGLSWQEPIECEEGNVCMEGRCISACEASSKVRSYIGCEYWTLDLDQYEDPFGDPRIQPHAVVISNPSAQAASVTVTTMAEGVTLDFPDNMVQPGEAKVFTFPRLDVDDTSISFNTFFIESSRPVLAHQFNPLNNVRVASNDASLLIPVAVLGQEYVGMTMPSGADMTLPGLECSSDEDCPEGVVCGMMGCENVLPAQSGYLTIIATSDGITHIEVVPSCAIEEGPDLGPFEAGVPISFDLQRYQVLNLTAAPALIFEFTTNDLTGTTIRSDKPVAVFGGHEEAVISDPERDGDNCCAEHLEQQLFPVETWGNRYLAAKAKPRGSDYDAWKIVATEDTTQIMTFPSQPGAESLLLHRGQHATFYSSDSFEIASNKPIMVGQFLISQGQTSQVTGDPAFILAVPIEQFRKSYLFMVPLDYTENYATIMRTAGDQIEIDGVLIPDSDFRGIGRGEFELAYQELNPGVHEIVGTQPCGLSIYGYAQAVSYGYPGGLELNVLEEE